MNLVLALCLLTLRPAGLLCVTSASSADPVFTKKSPSLSSHPQHSAERTKSPSKTHKNIAEFLLPIIDSSFSSDFRPINLKKKIKVLPIMDSKEHSSVKKNSHKKHIVEITPVRNKGHEFQPLAYILSPELSRGRGKKKGKPHKTRDYHDHIGYFVKKISPVVTSESSENYLDELSDEEKHLNKENKMSSNFSDEILYKTYDSSSEEESTSVSSVTFNSDESQPSSPFYNQNLGSTLSISLENNTSDYDSYSTSIENLDSNSASKLIESDGTDSSEIPATEYGSSNMSPEQFDSGYKYNDNIDEGNDSSIDTNSGLSDEISESTSSTEKEAHSQSITDKRSKDYNNTQSQKGLHKNHQKIYDSLETGVHTTETYFKDPISSKNHEGYPKTLNYLELVAVTKNQNYDIDEKKKIEKNNASIPKRRNENQNKTSSDSSHHAQLNDYSENNFNKYKLSQETYETSSNENYENSFRSSNMREISTEILNVNENNKSEELNSYHDAIIRSKTDITILKLENSNLSTEVDSNDLSIHSLTNISETELPLQSHEDFTTGKETLIYNQDDTLRRLLNLDENDFSDEENVNTDRQTELKPEYEFLHRELQHPIVNKNYSSIIGILHQSAAVTQNPQLDTNEDITGEKDDINNKKWMVLASNGMKLIPSSTKSSEESNIEYCDKIMRDHLDSPKYQHKAYKLSFLFNK